MAKCESVFGYVRSCTDPAMIETMTIWARRAKERVWWSRDRPAVPRERLHHPRVRTENNTERVREVAAHREMFEAIFAAAATAADSRLLIRDSAALG
jgi:hypothetical protein